MENYEKSFLKEYSIDTYERPSVATDIAVFSVDDVPLQNPRKLPKKELSILMVKRTQHPYANQWALPGGFLKPHETLEDCAQRELLEETGVSCSFLEQLQTFSEKGRDPRGWIISCAYIAIMQKNLTTLLPSTDAADAQWFSLNIRESKSDNETTWNLMLKSSDIMLSATVLQNNAEMKIVESDIAFDHAKILIYALLRLRKKLIETDAVVHFMSKQFTLAELQSVCEKVLNRKLAKPAFRQKALKFVQPTNTAQKQPAHRPAQFYIRREK